MKDKIMKNLIQPDLDINTSYPEISVSIKYSTTGIGSTTQEKKDLIITPVVKGKIVDTYVYENGTGYGSTVLKL